MIAKKTRRVGSIRFGSGPFGSVRATPKSPNKTSILTLKNRQNAEQDEKRNIVKFKKTPQSGDYLVFCVKNRHFLKCASPGKGFRHSLRPSILMGKPAQLGDKRPSKKT